MLHLVPISWELDLEVPAMQSVSAVRRGVRRYRAHPATLLHELVQSRLHPASQFRKALLPVAYGASPLRGRGVLRVERRRDTHTDSHLEFHVKIATEPASQPQRNKCCRKLSDPKHFSDLQCPSPPSVRLSWSREPTDD